VTELSYDIDQFNTLRSPILGKGIGYSRGGTIICFSIPSEAPVGPRSSLFNPEIMGPDDREPKRSGLPKWRS